MKPLYALTLALTLLIPATHAQAGFAFDLPRLAYPDPAPVVSGQGCFSPAAPLDTVCIAR